MSAQGERAEMEIPIKTGRDYWIDPLDVADFFMFCEDEMLATLTEEQRKGREGLNIDGIINYAVSGIKGPSGELKISYKEACEFPTQANLDSNCKRLGLLFFARTNADFDLVDNEGKVVIKRESPVVELLIPRVDFSADSTKALEPIRMGRSFDLLAKHLTFYDKDIEFVMGLTNPRIGRLVRRWNFLVEEQPFPEEVYGLIKTCLENKEVGSAKESLEEFKNQVLIYQPRQEFILRYPGPVEYHI